ncbi:MAG TPA: ribonuclease HII [Candidatus Thermoplasmatota archaeon]|nr:ribonuclease HII [Candidatus Thermoplasmatota archaeon]
MLAGVDEAGRGPVLGPLVVAAVLIESDAPLRDLGVKDSKQLTRARRDALEPRIRAVARRVETRVLPAEELNLRMPRENLNQIEAKAFAELLARLQPLEAVLDACDVNAERFGREVGARLPKPCVIRSEHEADARHPVVAAASIIAKTERDRQMDALADRYGDCGSGYSHDERTRAFLQDWVARRGSIPTFARREWETTKRLAQRSLGEFG